MSEVSRILLCAALIGAGALGTGAAEAQGRPDSLRMSCAAARGLIASRGAVVLGTGPNLYDRYVRSEGFCLPDEITQPAWVATADTRQCFIGYRCQRVSSDDWPF